MNLERFYSISDDINSLMYFKDYINTSRLSRFINFLKSFDDEKLFYHKKEHCVRVTFNSFILSKEYDLSRIHFEMLILTSIIHDYGYDKSFINPTEMELRTYSLINSKNLLHDFTDEEKTIILLLLMSTVISFRDDIRTLSKDNPFVSKIIEHNMVDIAQIISDADVLNSTGISYDEYEKQTSLIEKENNVIFTKEQKINFVENLSGPFITNQYYEKNRKDIIKKSKGN